MPFVKAVAVSEIPPGQAKQVSVQGKTLALFNLNGTFYAIDNECPHRNGPLAEGMVEGNEVVCPWHGARFDICSGTNLSPPARQGVKSYRVHVVGADVEVEI
jgi:nitrite reductase (NADH) small subunit/3-phenylpropionate/trans-cinnamate dioxygenase ferredoxin subunit